MAYKKKRQDRTTKESGAEITSDKRSANLLADKSHNYSNEKEKRKQKNRVVKKPAKVLPHQAKKKIIKRTYTEKELGIPKLNKSIDPEGYKTKGKKKKTFVNEDSMNLILATINEQYDSRNASKLEKARQLETIREAKRKEIEAKEAKKESKLDEKKAELLKKKKKNSDKKVEGSSNEKSAPKGKKRVSFA